ncbi:MAG: hypothetical protein ABEJ03_02355 [Candidatus Nanohaloarchaea archaeon]
MGNIEREMRRSLEKARKSRRSEGLETPENITLERLWSAESQRSARVDSGRNKIALNMAKLARDYRRFGRDRELMTEVEKTLAGDKGRDETMSKVMEEWNEVYSDEPEHSVSVSVIFHSLEQLVLRSKLGEPEDGSPGELAVDLVASTVRDRSFRNIGDDRLRQNLSGKTMSWMSYFQQKNSDLPEISDYRNVRELVEWLLDSDVEDIRKCYSGWKSPREILSARQIRA